MRDVRRAVVGVTVLAAVLLGWFLLVPRDIYTGTNALRTRSFVVEISTPGQRACFPGVQVPEGTGQVELEVEGGGGERAAIAFAADVGGVRSRDRVPPGFGRQKVRFDIPKTARDEAGTFCLRNAGGGKLFLGGEVNARPGQVSPVVDGRALPVRAAIWYRPPAGDKASILFHLPTIFQRAALFRPGWVGAWTYWLLMLVVVPALAYAALRVLLRPDRRRLALVVGALGFGFAAVWAHVTPTFDAPDETEHFAYVQSLAERGKTLERVPTGRPTWSSDEAAVAIATRVTEGAETADGKPPWAARDERVYDRIARGVPRDDGGGFAAAGSSHSPLFYALGVGPYDLGRTDSIFGAITATRLVSALLGGIVAACAVLIVLEIAPRRRRLAAAAGLAVAFQPMFAFMAGSVNNDMGVNALAAVVTYLLVRLLRRGFTLPLALALGLAVGLTPLMKATGFALYPAAALGVALAVLRHRRDWRAWLPGVIVAILAYAVVWEVWGHVASSLDRGTFGTPNGQRPGEGFPALDQKGGAFVYAWEVFFPRLPTMAEHFSQSWPAFDIYGLRGWGAFGWYALKWPSHTVYWVIMVGLAALAVLGLVALVRRRRVWTRRHVPEVLVLATVILGVLAVMIGAYYSPVPQGDLLPIQGRYVFPAITALAVCFAGAAHATSRRWGEALVAGLSTAVVCFGVASLWLVLGGFYFAAAW